MELMEERRMVLINIQMPKDCPFCPCSHYSVTGEFMGCEAVAGKKYAVMEDPEYANSNTRPEWCPMKEVQK